MNQTRTFLIFAWIMVAVLLWMEWGKEQRPPAAPTAATQPAAPANAIPDMLPDEQNDAVPGASAGAPPAPATGAVPAAGGPPPAAAADAGRVTVTTDVLRVTLGGGGVYDADLLAFPQSKTEANSPPVRLFDQSPEHYYVAQSAWVAQKGDKVPPLQPTGPQRDVALAKGQDKVAVTFEARTADGVVVRRTYTVSRGSYAIDVHDEVDNTDGKTWQGYIYRQLARIPPQAKRGMTNPESYSFTGATWYSAADGYQRRHYKDFEDDGPIDQTVTGGWVALLQHHFFTAWIPQADQAARFALSQQGQVYGIRASGPSFTLTPGEKAVTDARLWVGPKLVSLIEAQGVPGLDRAVDYSRFTAFAILGQGLFWLLSKLHGLFGNWGWAIIAMVCLLKLVLFPLSAAQYKSAAKMRRFQPRIAQLKERYGDDKQKFQTAMMELYKKEKINPVGGCLPVIPQMIIFMALYWMLMESVELRQAPWALWIQDLTARDPYFILPALNIAIMWATQKLTPAVGMDPMQQKMMQAMPLVFGVILAFLPAGLVLYQVANGGLGLLQQWIITKKYAEPPPGALVAK